MATASEILNAVRGDDGQNSLITLAEAEVMAVMSPDGDDWLSLTDDEMAQYLFAATDDIKDQTLFTGLDLSLDYVYAAAKKAVFAQAVFLVQNRDEINDAVTASISDATSVSGPVESKAVNGFKPKNARAPKAVSLLRQYCNFTMKAIVS